MILGGLSETPADATGISANMEPREGPVDHRGPMGRPGSATQKASAALRRITGQSDENLLVSQITTGLTEPRLMSERKKEGIKRRPTC